MSICPKNSKLENDCSELSKMQQMWCFNDAAQSMQSLRKLQQKRSYCYGC